jgi:hypothetical protein
MELKKPCRIFEVEGLVKTEIPWARTISTKAFVVDDFPADPVTTATPSGSLLRALVSS